ncbi:MAG: methyltransferase domain-containing protein [Coriobacteriales bacterium]|nr:methyltransferase domain-containing protein [Coriobacteriales bacterium]
MSKLTPARSLALDVIAQVDARDAFAANLIDTIVRTSDASQQDKDFAELLVYGAISTSGTLDELIDRNLLSPKDVRPNVRRALRISAYEMLFLGKADHAVVDQGVELVRSVAPRAAGLGNAVLRKMALDAKGFPWGDPTNDDAAAARLYGFPEWLAKRLMADLGREGAIAFMDASNRQAPIFIACNYLKTGFPELLESLAAQGVEPKPYGCIGCIRAGNRKAAVDCDALKDGRAQVTDASAQRAALEATPLPGRRFLEIGSGKGTKTILMQSHAKRVNGEQAELYSLDVHEFKLDVLEGRIGRFGVEDVRMLVGDATNLESIEGIPESFGKVLIDAPCSGIGTLRRHPEIRWKVTPETIASLAAIGSRMLASAARLIEPGGSIVYSTCTPMCEEDEDVVEAFLSSELGQRFDIVELDGQRFLKNELEPSGPDVHFIAKLDRVR